MANERGKFKRMFKGVPVPNKALKKPLRKLSTKQLKELGSLMGGRAMDMGKGDNPDIPTGFVSLGQFLAHDISFDPTPVSDRPIQLSAIENLRTPAFDLDSLYGDGPDFSPHFYSKEKRGRFLLDEGREFDLPRNNQGTALIGDLRNDTNLLLAQLHLAFLKFHNAVWDRANSIEDRMPNEGRFEKTQRLVRWHYQWIILREFLPRLVGRDTMLDVLRRGRKLYLEKGPSPTIPVEFSAAAFRFGHSQTHAVYRINDKHEIGRLPLFSSKPPSDKRHDLSGGPITKDYIVNWKYFFNTGVKVEPLASRDSKKIEPELPGPLLHNTPGQPGEPLSLAVRDLLRGKQRKLLSGQEVAEQMKAKPLADKELWDGDFAKTFQGKGYAAPLWYYILKEAEVQHDGMMLGRVGGRIVAEVIVGLLEEDPGSLLYKNSRGERKIDLHHLYTILRNDDYLKSDSQPLGKEDQETLRKKEGTWRPSIFIKRDGTFVKNEQGDFTIADLLRFAGVDTE